MSEIKTGGPAFPWGTAWSGMTLRDYFAAKAMQAILPTYNNVFDDETGGDDDPTFPELLAKDAYTMADAMLKAREQ
jgi:hypothetical protein